MPAQHIMDIIARLLEIIFVGGMIVYDHIVIARMRIEMQNNRNTIKDTVAEAVTSKIKEIEPHKVSSSERLLEVFCKLGSVIKEDLYSTTKQIEACRIGIYLYHNGTKSVSGVSFLKVSCIGERVLVGSGIQEQIYNHASMPINLFDEMTQLLVSEGQYIIMNDQASISSQPTKQFCSSSKVRYSQAVTIYDNNNYPLGFLLAEFLHPYSRDTSQMEYENLKHLVDKITPILSFSEYAELALNPIFSINNPA